MSNINRNLVNGKSTNSITLDDRGLQYGDGCFETIAVHQGKALLWDNHLSRLVTGCARLGIQLDDVMQPLVAESESIIQDIDRGVLKIIITRGAGARGYSADATLMPTRILSLTPWPVRNQDYSSEGIAMRLCDTRLSSNEAFAGIKHLNRLEQVLARSEWLDEYQEGLMLDIAGNAIEGTMSNIFIQRGGEVITPSLESGGVVGVMREVILKKLSEIGVNYYQSILDVESIYNADALFCTNSLIGLWPVTSFCSSTYPITELERKLQLAINDVIVDN